MKTILLSLFATLVAVSISAASGKTAHKVQTKNASQATVAQQPASTPSNNSAPQTTATSSKKGSKATWAKHAKSKKSMAMKHSRKHSTKKSAASGSATKNEKTGSKQ